MLQIPMQANEQHSLMAIGHQEKGKAELEVPDFPWHLGVFDAHCHPTDTASSIEQIPLMKTRALTVMSTRAQDQDLVAEFAARFQISGKSHQLSDEKGLVVPAFGWHPWFSHQIYDDLSDHHELSPNKKAHYEEVLSGPLDDKDFLESLPEPQPLSVILRAHRRHLEAHPLSLVGEVGLDRSFRIPGVKPRQPDSHPDPSLTPGGREGRQLSPHHVRMGHQRRILDAQLNLAGEMQRAVSVHGVAAHGVVYETLRATWRGCEHRSKRAKSRQPGPDAASYVAEPGNKGELQHLSRKFPPRLCLHSYSGTMETLRLYLHPSVPVPVFFSFSSLVNFSNVSKNIVDVIHAIPDDRILVESDLHAAGEKMDELMEDITRKICRIKDWPLEDGVKQLALNWQHFIFGSMID